jgi:phage tail protein X
LTTYITSDGDTADLIAWKYYGSVAPSVVEKLLDANTGLADYGPVLPAGVSIALPEIDVAAKTQGVKLWD